MADIVPQTVVFPLFDGITQLDFTGPAQFLSRMPGTRVITAAREVRPIATDSGFAILPGCSFADCPPADILCIPGGHGIAEALSCNETIDFVASQAAQANWLTSVCTGAFLLGAAGLLQGRRATTHWGYTHLLPMVGAVATPGRVVEDGPVITAGGVTSGIDFALTLIAFTAETRAQDTPPAAGATQQPPPAQPAPAQAAQEKPAARREDVEPKTLAEANTLLKEARTDRDQAEADLSAERAEHGKTKELLKNTTAIATKAKADLATRDQELADEKAAHTKTKEVHESDKELLTLAQSACGVMGVDPKKAVAAASEATANQRDTLLANLNAAKDPVARGKAAEALRAYDAQQKQG